MKRARVGETGFGESNTFRFLQDLMCTDRPQLLAKEREQYTQVVVSELEDVGGTRILPLRRMVLGGESVWLVSQWSLLYPEL